MTILHVVQDKFPLWLRKFRLADIRLDEVRADEIALEREEKRLEEALDKSQSEIDALAADVVKSGQKAKARRAVRKIMLIKDRVRLSEAELTQVSRHLTALGRLRRLVEGKEELASSGVLSKLERLPQSALERVLSGAAAREELVRDGLGRVAELMELPVQGQVREADDARQLREAFEAAIDARDPALASMAIQALEVAPAGHEVL